MRLQAIFLLLLLAFVPAARAELSLQAAGFLKEIGLDPDSARVKGVADDSVADRKGKRLSLDELARRKDASGVRRFIATRNFLRDYQADPNTRIPPADDYESSYLTMDERAQVRPAFRRAGDELYRNALKQKK
jgi:hypothetical protein